ncbi:hypothetical protein N7491_000557 [Penicillium cf. griseofulvum]|uniref:Cytochrome P450 n=1 Tax=Penicillium cf. griseofulvum TaxID=2972120 RepID=A0A9W9JMQ4_9EURO|nr:hypothetical protein N7472_004080 [Penicillium cf. griseofulvum]KAJ5443170.1 hypothetical protein N7445_004283 [Penicillium cf. griseofulvum]KAJ5451375.1 hypothetical protein N7491_000557 [Penicillium cf. griseofulvum]
MASLLSLGIGGLVIYLAVKSIYRLYFHPLSKIPGPKLAAITSGYEFYFNVIKGGMFIWELERLHEIYGPIIRIAPLEVHIKDSSYYDEIYASSKRRREKSAELVAQFDLNDTVFASISPEDHRKRRSHVDKHFSKQAVSHMEHLIYENIDKLDNHFKRAFELHKVINLDAGFAGLTSDVIHKYVYGFNSGNLDHDDFNTSVRDGVNTLFKSSHVLFFFPVLKTIMNLLPLWLLEKLDPFVHALVSQKLDLLRRTEEFLQSGPSNSATPPVMEVMCGPSMPENMRDAGRLSNEGFSMIIGGTETTARSLSIAAFRLLENELIKTKLREELRTVMPTPESRPTWRQLEQLPYLSAVVWETLRVSIGISSRSPRVALDESLVYKNYTIPAGTPVSETNYFVLTDPEIFPDPHTFDPARWLRAAAKGEHLDRYMVNFSKGSRICLGMNLAYAELFLVLAAFIRRYDMELFETSEKDIAFARDFGTPYPDEGSARVRVMVTKVIEE